jgi:ribosome biogenesis GTPase YqeH
MEEIKCIGCGATIQSDEPQKAGFIPANKLQEDSEDIVCKRCYRLKHYNEVLPSTITKDDFFNIISELGVRKAFVVKIIDVFDIEGTLIPQITKLTNHQDMMLIANKVDLLPKSVKHSKLVHHIKQIAAQNNLKPKMIHVMSAHKNTNLDDVLKDMVELSQNRDIYIVGATNVGKSTFVNAILKSYAGLEKDLITVSSHSGTTLNLIEIPIGDQKIIDTPGLINEKHIGYNLDAKSQKMLIPKKEIKPRTFQLTSDQTIFIGGLARLDFISDNPLNVTFYVNNELNLHRTKLENADQLFNERIGTLLTPPFEEKISYKMHRFNLKPSRKQDVVIPGLGFVSLKANLQMKLYLPDHVIPYVRDALI